MYGNDRYGLEQYGVDSSESGDEQEYFLDISRYVPPFIAELKEMAEIYRTQGYELGLLRHNLDDLINQFFITTATWGLTRWERIFGVSTNLSMTYERRREILMAKMRGQSTTTKQMIQDTAAAFAGGDVQVIEDNYNHHFIVRFIGIKGIPRNMQAFINMLEDIKPAHLSYEFQYTYTVWNNLVGLTWGELAEKTKTWDEVRIMEGV